MIVHIVSLATTGKGVASLLVNGHRRAVFVEGGVPGDVLEITITSSKKIYYEAEIVRIITPSAHRRVPICPHFGVCGACDFLHINYEEQLAQKKAWLEHFVSKSGLVVPAIQVITSPQEYYYRDRLRIHVRDGKACFYAKKSNELVPIKQCFIVNEHFNDVFTKQHTTSGDRRYVFDYATSNLIADDEGRWGMYDSEGLKMAYSPQGFVQNNLLLNKELVKTVVDFAQGDNILDLYAGNGNVSLPLARVGRVVAVEANTLSYELLVHNSRVNNVAVRAVQADADTYPAQGYDTVVLDPPRSGALNIERIDAPTIIYVSCNAQRMIKDIMVLKNYHVTEMVLLDMFAQTKHFETICVLKKK